MTLRMTGTRDELEALLEEQAQGWWHLGKPKLHAQAKDAVERLEQGDSSVRVGHTEYVVTDA